MNKKKRDFVFFKDKNNMDKYALLNFIITKANTLNLIFDSYYLKKTLPMDSFKDKVFKLPKKIFPFWFSKIFIFLLLVPMLCAFIFICLYNANIIFFDYNIKIILNVLLPSVLIPLFSALLTTRSNKIRFFNKSFFEDVYFYIRVTSTNIDNLYKKILEIDKSKKTYAEKLNLIKSSVDSFYNTLQNNISVVLNKRYKPLIIFQGISFLLSRISVMDNDFSPEDIIISEYEKIYNDTVENVHFLKKENSEWKENILLRLEYLNTLYKDFEFLIDFFPRKIKSAHIKDIYKLMIIKRENFYDTQSRNLILYKKQKRWTNKFLHFLSKEKNIKNTSPLIQNNNLPQGLVNPEVYKEFIMLEIIKELFIREQRNPKKFSKLLSQIMNKEEINFIVKIIYCNECSEKLLCKDKIYHFFFNEKYNEKINCLPCDMIKIPIVNKNQKNLIVGVHDSFMMDCEKILDMY